MALNFPSSPTLGEIYSSGGKTWVWGGAAWSSKVDVLVTGIAIVTGNSIDCSTGNYFTKEIDGNTTFTFDNAPVAGSYSFILEVSHISGSITWPTSVSWPGGTAPSLSSGKTHIFIFITDTAGVRWYGAFNSNYLT